MILDDLLDLYGYEEKDKVGSDGTVKEPVDSPTHGDVRGKFFKRNLPRALEKVGGKEEVRYDSGCYIPITFDIDDNWRVGFDGDMYEIVGIHEGRDFLKIATLEVTE